MRVRSVWIRTQDGAFGVRELCGWAANAGEDERGQELAGRHYHPHSHIAGPVRSPTRNV